MSRLLIDEPPLQVLPSLAVKIGLNEAIILQQFHYWLERSNNIRDGRKWIYNSVKNWQKQFPFWKSVTTINKALYNLEEAGLLITGNYNKAGFDKTKWYSINYEELRKLEEDSTVKGVVNDLPETGKRATRNCSMEQPETGKPIPRDYQETTQESSSSSDETTTAKDEQVKTDEAEVIKYLNNIVHNGKFQKSKFLRARLKEGYTVEQLKAVVYYCAVTRKWLTSVDKDGAPMLVFLRPSTLFRPENCKEYLESARTLQAAKLAKQQQQLSSASNDVDKRSLYS